MPDAFTWDCDGMGVGLNRQIQLAFNGKQTIITQFKGSEGPDNANSPYEPADGDGIIIHNQKTIKEAIKNKRAQYYYELRQRCYRTYESVVKGIYHDPDTMISFDSSIECLSKLRTELCRMPIKPNSNGLFELYTKKELKDRFDYHSPNLGDAVMMLMRTPPQPGRTPVVIPQPIRVIGRRR